MLCRLPLFCNGCNVHVCLLNLMSKHACTYRYILNSPILQTKFIYITFCPNFNRQILILRKRIAYIISLYIISQLYIKISYMLILVQVVPGIKRLTRKTVEFVNGRKENFDAIILATGYKSNVPSWLKVLTTFNLLFPQLLFST